MSKNAKIGLRGKLSLLATVCLLITVIFAVTSYFCVYAPPQHHTFDFSIDIEIFNHNDTSNKITWQVKGYGKSIRNVRWEDISGILTYINGTEIKNCTMFPSGYIKAGDLIVVVAPWDGDAEFILRHKPTSALCA